ncbi:MAG: hypothetical protein LQ340_008055, partial [Diploschistes diacapsis]
RRLHNRRKKRAMVRRHLFLLLPILPPFSIPPPLPDLIPIEHLRIRPAPEPKNIRPVHRTRQIREVLAAIGTREVLRAEVVAEDAFERLSELRCQHGVVLGHGERAQHVEVRLLGRIGRRGLRAHDALDGRQDAVADRSVGRADVDLERGGVGDDVVGVAGADAGDGDDGEVFSRLDLARDDVLQAHGGVGGHQHGVDAARGLRRVAAVAVQRDEQRVRRGELHARHETDGAGALGHDVLPEQDVRDRDPGVQPVADHARGAAEVLFRRLEEDD